MNMGAVAHLSRFQCVAYYPLIENHVSLNVNSMCAKRKKPVFSSVTMHTLAF